MEPTKRILLFMQALAVALVLSGCAADFLFEGNKNQQTKNEDDHECECDEPHPNPIPSPTPKPPKSPCVRRPPPVVQCNLKVILDVAQLLIVRNHGPAEIVPIVPGSIDLCELSKDYFGTINRAFAPRWRTGDKFTKAIFILSSRLERNRVENIDGSPICSLRLPPGMTAGVRFEPVSYYPLSVETGLRVSFDFDQNDALHTLGIGICQLKHPVGHFDLREGR